MGRIASREEQVTSLTRRDPLAFGITYLDLLDGKAWSLTNRAWCVEPYSVLNPWEIEKYPIGTARRETVIKSTQAGVSTLGMTKMFHMATGWPCRIAYGLPRQQDTIDMVTTRIDPMIGASKYLKELLGTPDSAHAKKLGDTYIYFMELSVEPRMLPIDFVIADEVDLCNPDNLSTLSNRMDASRWALSLYLSTPTISNFGIHASYVTSDMRKWVVRCPACGHDQVLDWEKNIRVVGSQDRPTKVYYGCGACDKELTLPIIQEYGRWVAEHPDLSSEHIGFHVSQMMTKEAGELWRHFRDPQTKISEFYRKRLGMPYEIGGGSIEREDFLVSCFDEPYDFESVRDNDSYYYMGVDQGNELQVVVVKKKKGHTRKMVVHIERIPLDIGFSRLPKLMAMYGVRRCVIDGNPNRHSALNFQKMFPGRVILADYIEGQKQALKTAKDVKTKTILSVSINRTAGFDGLSESIKDGAWQLPGNAQAIHPEVELLIDHVTSMRRDVEDRRTASGVIEVAVWKKLRADHYAHSMLYASVAETIDTSRGSKIKIIGDSEPDTKEEENEDDPLTKETYQGIVWFLAEVPKEQMEEHLLHNKDADYKAPFPLSYKITRVLEKYTEEDMLLAMEKFINST